MSYDINEVLRGLEGSKKKKTFKELMDLIDRDHIEEIFEEGFKIGAFDPRKNRNVVRWTLRGKVYELQRFET